MKIYTRSSELENPSCEEMILVDNNIDDRNHGFCSTNLIDLKESNIIPIMNSNIVLEDKDNVVFRNVKYCNGIELNKANILLKDIVNGCFYYKVSRGETVFNLNIPSDVEFILISGEIHFSENIYMFSYKYEDGKNLLTIGENEYKGKFIRLYSRGTFSCVDDKKIIKKDVENVKIVLNTICYNSYGKEDIVLIKG